jgi:hypothetical protein
MVIKTTHFKHLPAVLFGNYDRPTESSSMRPANESCERCHWPAAFHDNAARQITHFSTDQSNTLKRTYLLLRTGKGTPDSGQGFDIHWHIANKVEYIAADSQKQRILWVRAELPDGRTVDYSDLANPLSPEQIQQSDRRIMDCVDCHNRIGHPFPSPSDLLDRALADGRLNPSLPYAKRVLLELLTSYSDQSEALAAADTLPGRYREAYPGLAGGREADLQQASELARELVTQLVFEEPGVSWKSFYDNSGHRDSAGCFRCHDGLHASDSGETIRLQCNLCHNIPVTVGAGEAPPDLPYVSLELPEDHRSSNFVRDHRFRAEETCTECHGEIVYGTDDSTFCANSACHDQQWPRLDLDAGFSHPIELSGGHQEATCYDCHNGAWQATYQCANCHEPPDSPHYGSECQECHTPTAFDAASAGPFTHPTQLEGEHLLLDCSSCHDRGVVQGTQCDSCHPGPEDHVQGVCSTCHTPDGWAESGRQAAFEAPAVPHAMDASVECMACHSPYGQNWPAPASHLFRSPSQCSLCHEETDPLVVFFDPSLIDHDLLGLHRQVDCRQCHSESFFLETPTACSACHDGQDGHTAAIDDDCTQCHSPVGWAKTGFDHALTTFALLGLHEDVACHECHADDLYASTPGLCFTCHQADDAHAGQFGQNCAQCHTPSGWFGAVFDHASTGFPLTGRHVSTSCLACHEGGAFEGTSQDCVACHAQDDAHNGGFGPACVGCHTTAGWDGATFDHAQTAFALTGAHSSAACVQCHPGNSYAGAPQACVSCHAPQDKHGGGFGQDCARCHNTSGWGGASFDHGQTAFVLTGAHVGAACAQCHPGNSYAGTPQACVSCHAPQDKHNGGFGQDCAHCHNTGGWGGAAFDHNSTSFPLSGAHAGAACTQCHGGGVYQGTPQTCSACHGEPGYHAGILGTDCASCHSDAGWLPASYNRPHSFPFDHEEAGWLSCRACHPNNLASTSCTSCHDDDDDD